MPDTTNASKQLADEYIRLGGTRRALMDDNLTSTQKWDDENNEAAKFWEMHIEPLPELERKDVEKFLPDNYST